MKHSISASLMQIVGLWFLLGILVFAILIFAASTDPLVRIFRGITEPPCGYHTELVTSALNSNMVASFLPIISVLPFSGSYVDEIKCKFSLPFLIRTSYLSYLYSRIFVCFLSGGFVLLAGIILSWTGSALLLFPMEQVVDTYTEPLPLFLKSCGLLFLNGGLWSVIGMTMSTILESKYIAYASPFIIYYLLVILYERYLPNCILINPREWINPSSIWPLGCWGPSILIMEITVIFVLIFIFRARRRLQEL